MEIHDNPKTNNTMSYKSNWGGVARRANSLAIIKKKVVYVLLVKSQLMILECFVKIATIVEVSIYAALLHIDL